jgi:hypothetical protein
LTAERNGGRLGMNGGVDIVVEPWLRFIAVTWL